MPLFTLSESVRSAHVATNQPPKKLLGVLPKKSLLADVGALQMRDGVALKDVLGRQDLAPEETVRRVQQSLTRSGSRLINELLDSTAGKTGDRALAPAARDFFAAVVNRIPVTASSFELGAPVAAPPSVVPGYEYLAAAQQFRRVLESGELPSFYRAAVGAPSSVSAAEAHALFSALPALRADARAEDFVASGLWRTLPAGLPALRSSARYVPGRQVLVDTHVNADLGGTHGENRDYLSFQADGPFSRTHRAQLVGEAGNDFLVRVDGNETPLAIPKDQVMSANAPHELRGASIQPGNMFVSDYASPFMKAKVAEVAIKMERLVQQLDFARALESPAEARRLLGNQQAAVQIVHDAIDMLYPHAPAFKVPFRYSGPDAGRQAVRGIGMCFQQTSVLAGLLAPFRDPLGVDLQMINGGAYQHRTQAQPSPLRQGDHGWLQLSYRPSMDLRVVDRTWAKVNQTADEAYSRFGGRYPASLMPGMRQEPLAETDVRMDPSIEVQRAERRFGVEGQSGREDHIGDRQNYF